MRSPLLTTGLCTLLISHTALAANWVEVGGNSKVTAYVDTQSIRKIGPKVKIWTKWVHTEPVEIKRTYPKKTYMVGKELSVFNCVERTTLTLRAIDYAEVDSLDVVRDASAPDIPSRYTEIAPETIGEIIFNFACKEPSKKK